MKTRQRKKAPAQESLQEAEAPKVVTRSRKKRDAGSVLKSGKKQLEDVEQPSSTPLQRNRSRRGLQSSSRKGEALAREENSICSSLQRSQRDRKKTPKGEAYSLSVKRDKGEQKNGRVAKGDLQQARKKLVYEDDGQSRSPEKKKLRGTPEVEAAEHLMQLFLSPSREEDQRNIRKSTSKEQGVKKCDNEAMLDGRNTENESMGTGSDSAIAKIAKSSDSAEFTAADDDDDDRTWNLNSNSGSFEEITRLPSDAIDLVSEDDDYDVETVGYEASDDLISADIFRYSIGKDVYYGSFTLKFNTKHNQMSISSASNAKGKRKHKNMKFCVEKVKGIQEIKYSVAEEFPHQDPNNIIDSILSFKVHVRNIKGHESLTPMPTLPTKGTVQLVVEIPRENVLQLLLRRQLRLPKKYTKVDEFVKHASPLLEHAQFELSEKAAISGSWKAPKELKGMNDNDLLLTYPFASTEDIEPYELACAKLNELKTTVRQQVEARKAGLVEMKLDDLRRVQGTNWLNCNLVNFWMCWITRDNPQDTLVCNSYFYTKLSVQGEQEVQRWFRKKNIFDSRMVIIPICKNLHWTLCIILNAGAYTDEPQYKGLSPSIIVMDSAGAPSRYRIEKKIMKWIRFEYNRIYGADLPFKTTLHRICPQVPQQNNGYDCGVYICKYAYAIYQIRSSLINYSMDKGKKGFFDLIEKSTEFKFLPKDITRIRRELKCLITSIAIIRQQKPSKTVKLKKVNDVKKNSDTAKEESVGSLLTPPSSKENPLSLNSAISNSKLPLGSVDSNSSKTVTIKVGTPMNAKKEQRPTKTHNSNDYPRSQQTQIVKRGISNIRSMKPKKETRIQNAFASSSIGRTVHGIRTDVHNRSTVQLSSSGTRYRREHVNVEVVRSLSSDLDSIVSDQVWAFMPDMARVTHIISRLTSAKMTNYTEHHLTMEYVSMAQTDLDQQVSDDVWSMMDELSRMSFIMNRLQIAKQLNMPQQNNLMSHQASQLRPPLGPISDARLMNEHQPKQQQYQHKQQFLPTTKNLVPSQTQQTVGFHRARSTPPTKQNGYITMAGPTPQRTELMKTVGAITQSRAKKSDRWVDKLKANSLNPNTKDPCGDDESAEIECTGAKRQKSAPPNRIAGVFKTSNKKKLLRDGINFHNRFDRDLRCEPFWPQAHGVFMIYNEIKRNASGTESNSAETKKRERTQLNFLGSSEQALSDFKKVFPPENIDPSKYDVAYTVDPNKWVARLGEEDGNRLIRGTSAEAAETFSKIQESEDGSDTDFTPRK